MHIELASQNTTEKKTKTKNKERYNNEPSWGKHVFMLMRLLVQPLHTQYINQFSVDFLSLAAYHFIEISFRQ